jgi:predicted transcriptional regulator
MKLDLSEQSLPVYEALASQVRLQILQLLIKQPMNLKELAQTLGLSGAIMSMHVKKLATAGLILTDVVPSKSGVQKICTVIVDQIQIEFPLSVPNYRKHHTTVVPIGHYIDFQIEPTCGLATTEKLIGTYDDPRCFLEPDRMNAKILWFGKGFIEYKVPNYLMKTENPIELEISMEISSEAPDYQNNWPSDITFFFNGVSLGTWTSPGDYGGVHGKYTPNWWPINLNQYGLFKMLRINSTGTYIDGTFLSNVTIDQIDIRKLQWTFRIAILDDAANIGGATLFGSGFGNYNEDINFNLIYS